MIYSADYAKLSLFGIYKRDNGLEQMESGLQELIPC